MVLAGLFRVLRTVSLFLCDCVGMASRIVYSLLVTDDPAYTTHTVDSRDMRIAFKFYDDESLGCDLTMTQFGAYTDGYNATTTGHLTQAQAWRRIFDLTRDGWAYRGEWRSGRFPGKQAS